MTDFQKSLTRFMYVAIVMAFAIAVWTLVRPASLRHASSAGSPGEVAYNGGRPSGVTTTGTCIVRTKPDLVEVTLGVEQSSRTAKAANDYVKSRMKKIIEILKANGVAAKDIQTEYANLTPSWDRHLQGMKWHADEGVHVRVRKMESVATLVDAAVKAGANKVGKLEFTVDNLDELRAKGRAEAAAVAHRKAEQLATSLGGKLGRLVTADENYPEAPRPNKERYPYQSYYSGEYYPGYYYSSSYLPRMAQSTYAPNETFEADGGRVEQPQEIVVQPGQMIINVNVRATYELE